MDISVKYLGYTLKNPIIVGSSGLTNTVEKIKKLAANNAGAVVLKSLFEEQILAHATHEASNDLSQEAYDYIKEYTKIFNTDKYFSLIENARKSVDIPIIASINARTDGEWIEFAKKVESAGAHAIELNISILPSDPDFTGQKNEKLHLSIIEKVRKEISIPIVVKLSSYSGSLAYLIQQIAWSKNVESIVLFNRFYNPDIDINKMEIMATNVFSAAEDSMPSLRWIGIMADKYPISFVPSTGVYTGEDVIKQILVGATAVQMVSAIYKHGESYINTVLNQLKDWMKQKSYFSLNDFRGTMNMNKLENPNVYERVQFMKYFGENE